MKRDSSCESGQDDHHVSTKKKLPVVTEEMYFAARDSVGRKVIPLLSNLLGETIAISQSQNNFDPESSKTRTNAASTVEIIAKLKDLYKSVHVRRARLQPDEKVETQRQRTKIMTTYSSLILTMVQLEEQVKKWAPEVNLQKSSNEFLIQKIEGVSTWTWKRFRRTDYFLMHRIFRRLEIITAAYPSNSEGSKDDGQQSRASECTSRTSLSIALTGNHSSLATSKVTSAEYPTQGSSSDYSCFEDEPKTIAKQKKTKQVSGLFEDDRLRNLEVATRASVEHCPDNMNYRSVSFGACKLNSECNCYHCFPLNLPEDDDDEDTNFPYNDENETDTIAVIWDLKGCNKTFGQNRRKLTEQQKWEERRFAVILKNFEKAILEAENMTFGNMVWDGCCCFGAGCSNFCSLIAQLWNFLKNRKHRLARVRPAPNSENYADLAQGNENGVGIKKRDLKPTGHDKGDYVAVEIENDRNNSNHQSRINMNSNVILVN